MHIIEKILVCALHFFRNLRKILVSTFQAQASQKTFSSTNQMAAKQVINEWIANETVKRRIIKDG